MIAGTRGYSLFITRIYIAPLPDNYSEALPTHPRLKSAVLRLRQNVTVRTLGSRRKCRESPFQIEGPATEKARRSPRTEVRPAQKSEENGVLEHPGWSDRAL